jgi:NitT/TauT family transport system substrate-binding protein
MENCWGKRLIGSLLQIFLFTASADALAEPKDRFVLAVDRMLEIRNLPVLIADRQGYFRAEGLNVTVTDMREDVPTEEQMADGRIDGAMAFYHHTILGQSSGFHNKAVIAMGISPAVTIMVANRLKDAVKSAVDLKGRKIITGGGNSGKTTAANWYVTHAGLNIDDITRLPLSDREKMLHMLTDGSADAIVTHEPDATYYAEKNAAFVLADITEKASTVRALGNVFPTTALYLPVETITAKPETVQHLVNALVKALSFINTHNPKEIAAILPKQALGKTPDEYLAVLTKDVRMYETDGRFSSDAISAEWKVMAALNPNYRNIDLAETYTNQFVDAALRMK